MKRIKAYTLGGNNMKWRNQIETIFEQNDSLISFVHPPLYKIGLTDEEFKVWNRQQIFNSDIVIINVEEINETNLYEIGIIDTINTFTNKHIFVIGVGEPNIELCTFIKSIIFHYEPIYEDAVDFIQNFLSI